MKYLFKLSIFTVFILAYSCSQDEVSKEDPENLNSLTKVNFENIKIFKDMEDFNNTLELFGTFSGNPDFEKWSGQQTYTSARHSDKISLEQKDELPFTFSYILNENKQFMIGNSMITLSEGVYYEDLYDDLGQVIETNKKFGTFTRSEMTTENIEHDNTVSRVNLSADGDELKDWEEFVRVKYRTGCGTPYNKSLRYRLVYYLEVEENNLGGAIQSDILFRLRMSQKRSSGWLYNNTSTERLYDVNVSGSYIFRNQNGLPAGQNNYISYYTIDDQNSCYYPLKGTKSYWIAGENNFTPHNYSLYYWDISLNGTVFHKVNGDTNEVNESVNW